MTDPAKLQSLFEAALRDSTPVEKAPTRAVPPTPAFHHATTPTPAFPKTKTEPSQPSVPAFVAPTVDPARQTLEVAPVLDKEASKELGALLDEQVRRNRSKRRRESLVAAIVLIGMTGGGAAWFVHSPERVHALTAVIAEIRSVGDVKSIVAKYQAALEKIKVHGNRIDHASMAMGVKPGEQDEIDPNFDTEMKEMMGGEGKTVGDRTAKVEQAFGKTREKHGDSSGEIANTHDEEQSFDWNR